MLKEATIHFCLFDESHFSNICTLYYVTIECVEIKYVNIGKGQKPSIFSFSKFLYWIENTVFPVSIALIFKLVPDPSFANAKINEGFCWHGSKADDEDGG